MNKLDKLLSWYSPSNSGAFQKKINNDYFSLALVDKPLMSFSYISFEYDETVNRYVIDGIEMTEEQKIECFNYISSVEPEFEWYYEILKYKYLSLYQNSLSLLLDYNKDQYMVSSWDKQVEEARKVLGGENSEYLNILLTERVVEGETLEMLANKIIEKSSAFELSSIKIIAKYEGQMNRISTIKTIDEIKTIYDEYSDIYTLR